MAATYPQRQIALANFCLLVLVPLTMVPGLEDAVGIPKLAVFLFGAGLLTGTTLGNRVWKEPLAVCLAVFYMWRAVAPLELTSVLDLRWERLLLGFVAVAWLAYPPHRASKGLLLVGAFEVGLGLFQFLGLDPTGFAQMGNFRAPGTFNNSSTFCMFVLPLAYLAWERGYPKLGLWLLLAPLVSGARAGLVGLAVSATYLATQLSKEKRRLLGLALLLPIALLLITQVTGHRTRLRSAEGHQVRVAFLIAASALVEKHPAGLGPGQFGLNYLPYRELEPELSRGKAKVPKNCHNEPFGLGVEAGLPAMLLALLILVLAWQRLESPFAKAALLALTVQMLFFRASLPTELLWLYLITAQEPERSGHLPAPLPTSLGLLVALASLTLTLPWCTAERAAYRANRYEIEGNWTKADQSWKAGEASCAPSRRPKMGRRRLSCQLHLDPAAGQMEPRMLSKLTGQQETPDPYQWAIRGAFLSRSDSRAARRAFLQALLLDPWNDEFEDATNELQKPEVESQVRRSPENEP